MRYPRRYPFMLLGGERQSRLSTLLGMQTRRQPATLWSSTQRLTTLATAQKITYTGIILKILITSYSRLDYCNSLYYTLTRRYIGRLQRVQNTVCRVVCTLVISFQWYNTISWKSQLASSLIRILSKINMLSYKAITTGFLKYLISCLKPCSPIR